MENKYLFLMRTENFGGAERLQIDYFKSINFDKYSVAFGVNIDIFSRIFNKNNLPVKLLYLPALSREETFFIKFLKYYKFFNVIKPMCIVFNQFWLKSFSLPEVIAAFLITKGNVYMIVHDCPPVCPKDNGKKYFGFIPGLGLSWKRDRLLQTLLGYFTKNTIAVSNATKDSLIRLHKFPSHNVKRVYHGVNIDDNVPSVENRIKLRKELNISNSDNIIVSTAMLYQGKRLDRLVEAFAILAQERNDVQLIIVGSGSEHSKLIGMVNSLSEDIKRRIKFLGFQENIPVVLQLSDIFVLPSDSEGLPLACLEAMSCGLISIVKNCGGPVEIIKDGSNGFLVEKSREGVANGIKRALNLSSEEKGQISHNARKFVEEKFDLKKNIHSGLKLLKIGDG